MAAYNSLKKYVTYSDQYDLFNLNILKVLLNSF